MKIFFSYGHDHHSEFINKIKNDLRNEYNIDVWIDSEELKARNDWEIELENAISSSDEVVFFITPYSSRRPDGYCLNELAFSIANNKDITPVMVDYVTPPLSICRIQYIDIQNLVDKFDNYQYEVFLTNLSNILLNNKSLSMEGEHTTFLDNLNPIDFSIDIQKHLTSYVGREWLYEKVNSLLNEDYRLLWIKAKAGFGKTAFSTMLQYKHPNAVGIHYCQFDSSRRKSALNVLKTLIFQLSTQIPDYKEIISNYDFNNIKQKDEQTLFEELLLEPLNTIEKNENYFFIIDALDESVENGKNKLADMIKKFVDLPNWLKIVITSRPEPYLSRKLSHFKTLEIDTSSEQNLSDLKLYIKKNIDFKSFVNIDENSLLNKLIENSEGNILYLKEVIKNLNEEQIDIKDIDSLPKGMDALYLDMFERYFEDTSEYKKFQRPLFELMVSTKESISFNFIKNTLEWDDYDLEDAIEPIGSIVDIKKEKVKFFHKSISDWITDRSKSGRDYFVSAEKGENRILDFVMNKRTSNYKKLLSNLSEAILILNVLQKKCMELLEDELMEDSEEVYEKISLIRKLIYNYPKTYIYSGLKEFNFSKEVNINDVLNIEKNNYIILKTMQKSFSKDYIFSMVDYSFILTETGNFKESIQIQEKLLSEIEKLSISETSDWLLPYISALNELAIMYGINGEVKKALKLDHKSLDLLEENFNNKNDFWNEIYINTLSNLAMSYSNTADTTKALQFEEISKEHIEKLYDENSEKWQNYYIKCLNNHSISLKDTNSANLALKLENDILNIIKENYTNNSSLWVNKYTLVLNNLAYTYKIIGDITKAIELESKALELSRLQYEKFKGSWSHIYLKSMLNLALSYKTLWKLDEAIELESLVVEISKALYSQNPSRWADVYTRALTSLAITYSIAEKHDDSYTLENKSIEIRKKLYKYDSKRWVDAYSLSVNNFAITNLMINNVSISSELFIENLNTREKLYNQNPERWEYIYAQSLTNMSLFTILTDNYNNSLNYINQAYDIYHKLYTSNPDIWVEGYTKVLIIKGVYLYFNNDFKSALKYMKLAYEKRRELYLSNKMRRIEVYISSLMLLSGLVLIDEIEIQQEDYTNKIIEVFDETNNQYVQKVLNKYFSDYMNIKNYDSVVMTNLIKKVLLLELSSKQSPYRWSDAFM